MTPLIQQLNENNVALKDGDFVYFGPLFRGSTDPTIGGDPFYRLPIRTDRRPRDTLPIDAHLFNVLFEMVHGVKNIRSRCVFGTPEYETASYYGNGEGGTGSVSVLLLPRGTKVAYHAGTEDSVDPMLDLITNLRRVSTSSGETIDHIMQMTDPVAVVELINDLIEQLGEQDQRNTRNIFDHKLNMIKHYKIVTVTADNTNIPSCEYMIFDQPHVYGITFSKLSEYAGESLQSDDNTPLDDDGEPMMDYALADQAFDIIKRIVSNER